MSFWRVPFERSLQRLVRFSSRSKKSNHRAILDSRDSRWRTRPTKYRYSNAVRYEGGDSTSGTIPTKALTRRGSSTTFTSRTCAPPDVGRIFFFKQKTAYEM